MLKQFKKAKDRIVHYANQHQYPYKLYGYFQIISNPLFYLHWFFFNSHGYESLGLRLVISLTAIPLVLVDRWPARLKPYLPIYWYLTLLYAFPYFFTYMLLKNQFNFNWALNAMSAIVWGMLILDMFSLSILLCVGIVLAVVIYHISNGAIHWEGDYVTLLMSYFSVIVFGALFAVKREKAQAIRCRSMEILGGAVAHELRTPLLSISSIAEGLKRVLPKLVDLYEVYQKNALALPREKRVTNRQLALFKRAPEAITTEIRQANLSIDMMLMNLKVGHITHHDPHHHTIQETLNKALKRYPLGHLERARVSVNIKNNFVYFGEENLLIHTFFNLLKNALFFIKAEGRGEITISTREGDDKKYNRLVFEDNAKGIPKHQVEKLFNAFQSKRKGGTGIGLAFCNMVMFEMGGDITCESEEGKYTRFILCFPVVEVIL